MMARKTKAQFIEKGLEKKEKKITQLFNTVILIMISILQSQFIEKGFKKKMISIYQSQFIKKGFKKIENFEQGNNDHDK